MNLRVIALPVFVMALAGIPKTLWAQDCTNPDLDGDGFDAVACGGLDCNDEDSTIFPGAVDSTDNGVDNDCDGVPGVDGDGDGFASIGSGGDDCDDGDGNVNPFAVEVCGDLIDNDCDDFGGPETDEDSDDCTSGDEDLAGTDMCDGDTDNDSLLDGFELGPNCAFAFGELDPLDADTDDDGIADGDGSIGAARLQARGRADRLNPPIV